MWVKLSVSKIINHKRYSKGEWVDVSADLATSWIANDHAESLNIDSLLNEEGLGVVYPPSGTSKKPILPFKKVTLAEGHIKPLFPRSLLLNAPYSIMDKDSPDLLRNAGRFALCFELLKKWDVVLILASFDRNASKAGDAAEREYTRGIIHDLRVPYYQSCAIGVQDNSAGKEFCEALSEEQERGRILAPLRAFYRVKPLAYFLPPNWGRVSE